MTSLTLLSVICGYLQILGLVLAVVWSINKHHLFLWVPIGVAGFAAIVKAFLPLEYHQDPLGILAAMFGFGQIALGTLIVAHQKLKITLQPADHSYK